jgi:hypothetical protein
MSNRFFFFLLPMISCSEYELSEKLDTELGTETDVDVEDEGTPVGDTATQDPVDENAPVAVCEVAPIVVTPPFTSAVFDGSGSYDPNDEEIVMYLWELVEVPEGSAALLPYESGIQISDFYADLAGDYVAQLTVTNASGLSDACQTTLEAIPAQNLWVEMFWVETGDDMDLHLLAPNGTLEDSQTDCYFSTCTFGGLDWGQQGVTQDDPNLDIDDISGVGPENINIFSPETSGEYTIIVHDYPGSVYDPANEVTVNVYLNGTIVWTDTRTITGEDSYTYFAKINWANQTVNSL